MVAQLSLCLSSGEDNETLHTYTPDESAIVSHVVVRGVKVPASLFRGRGISQGAPLPPYIPFCSLLVNIGSFTVLRARSARSFPTWSLSFFRTVSLVDCLSAGSAIHRVCDTDVTPSCNRRTNSPLASPYSTPASSSRGYHTELAQITRVVVTVIVVSLPGSGSTVLHAQVLTRVDLVALLLE